jgi:hypothetical protein
LFQYATEGEFRSVIERNLGRKVRAFNSGTDSEADVSAEAFSKRSFLSHHGPLDTETDRSSARHELRGRQWRLPDQRIESQVPHPAGYGVIPKDLTPPGYICMATVDDPRPGHHHDNAHWGNCMPLGSRLGAWSWFSVLPPAN